MNEWYELTRVVWYYYIVRIGGAGLVIIGNCDENCEMIPFLCHSSCLHVYIDRWKCREDGYLAILVFPVSDLNYVLCY